MPQLPASAAVTPAAMLASTVDLVKALIATVRKDGRKFKLASEGLKAALDDADTAGIQRCRTLLDTARKMLDLNMSEVQQAQEAIARLRADATLQATQASAIDKLAKAVAHARRVFIERVQLARELDARADETTVDIRQDQRDAEVAIGALRLRIRGTVRTLTDAMADAERLAAAARKACEQKNQKALTDARTKLIDLKAFDRNVARLRPEVEKLAKAYPDLGRVQKAEVQWLRDDLERVADVPAAIDRLVKDALALGQVPVQPPSARGALATAQAQKLLKAFGLPDGGAERAKAAKVFADAKVDAWPRGLAKVYGCQEAALKARLAAVRKLPFVKAREAELIDV